MRWSLPCVMVWGLPFWFQNSFCFWFWTLQNYACKFWPPKNHNGPPLWWKIWKFVGMLILIAQKKGHGALNATQKTTTWQWCLNKMYCKFLWYSFFSCFVTNLFNKLFTASGFKKATLCNYFDIFFVCWGATEKNTMYGRHWISQSVHIVKPMQKEEEIKLHFEQLRFFFTVINFLHLFKFWNLRFLYIWLLWHFSHFPYFRPF